MKETLLVSIKNQINELSEEHLVEVLNHVHSCKETSATFANPKEKALRQIRNAFSRGYSF